MNLYSKRRLSSIFEKMQRYGRKFKAEEGDNYGNGIHCIRQCFICDSVVSDKGTPLLMSTTPYSKISLPTKIGQLLGDDFIVIVTAEDFLCRRCSSLIIRLDKLESDMEVVRKALTGYLKLKYQLYGIEKQSQLFDPSFIGKAKKEVIDNPKCDDQLIFQPLKETDLYYSNDENNVQVNIKEEQIVDDYVNHSGDLDAPGYKCVSCQYTTTSSSVFMEHLKIHSSEVYFKCANCDVEFHSHEDIEAHIMTVHDSDNLEFVTNEVNGDMTDTRSTFYECNVCHFQSSDKASFDSHVLKHKAMLCKCPFCFKRVKSKALLKKHMKSHRIFKCGLCSVTFKEKNSLLLHFEQHRNPENHQTVNEENEIKSEVNSRDAEVSVSSWLNQDEDKNVALSSEKEAEYDRVERLLEQIHGKTPDDELVGTNAVQNIGVDHNLQEITTQEDTREKNLDENVCKQSMGENVYEQLMEGNEQNVDRGAHELNIVEDIPEQNLHENILEPTLRTDTDEQNLGVDDSNLENQTENEDIFKEIPNEAEETSFLLENTFLSKNGVDHMSPEMDRNEGSETNDNVNDPSSYLENMQPNVGENGEVKKTMENSNSLQSKDEYNQKVDQTMESSLLNNENTIDAKNKSATPVKKRVYMCSICGLRAYTESHMKRHFKSHVAIEKKIYECHICNKVLTTRSNLNRHLVYHENCPGMVTCKLCHEELTDRLHLKQHLEDQHTGPQHCSFCNMEFTSRRAFKEHELTHPERAIHQCEICHKRFLTQLRLRTHLENIHCNSNDGEMSEKTYKCHICSKMLTTYHNLKRHVRNHEKSSGNVKCSICSEELMDKLHLRQHVEEMHPETHQCPFCQKVFSNKKVCKAHELTHPERYVYKCDMCEKMFLNETRLEKHKTVFHRDPHCRYCEKEIEDPTKLFNHERRHEMYKNKFSCKLCTKVFRTPSGLKYHMSVHTGKYAVYCEVCGKGMHSEIVLEEHKATHTKEIRYTCELCGRNFTSNSTYRIHRKWHDDPLPYKCKICDQKFKHTSILAVHMRRAHTGERPYKCPHCPCTFSVSSTLHKHIILHTKKYPHNCTLCGKGFTTRTKIARHMAKVHNDFEMLNAKPTPCQYKMALKPSEMSSTDPEDSVLKQEEQFPDSKFEDDVVEEQIVEAGQTIFLFQ